MSMTNEARQATARAMMESHHKLAKERISAAVAEILKDLRINPIEDPQWSLQIAVFGYESPAVLRINSISGIENLEVKTFGDLTSSRTCRRVR